MRARRCAAAPSETNPTPTEAFFQQNSGVSGRCMYKEGPGLGCVERGALVLVGEVDDGVREEVKVELGVRPRLPLENKACPQFPLALGSGIDALSVAAGSTLGSSLTLSFSYLSRRGRGTTCSKKLWLHHKSVRMPPESTTATRRRGGGAEPTCRVCRCRDGAALVAAAYHPSSAVTTLFFTFR